MSLRAALLTAAVCSLAGAGQHTAAPGMTTAWLQWGGPQRNFVVEAPPLATSWPQGGPARLWRRPLGDGFSSIVTDGTTLYTLYRDGADDVVIAMEAASGKTRWESRYAAPFNETCSQQLGPAPRAAPLVTGDRLITVSAGGLMHSFDRHSGARQWTRDLLAGKPDTVRACGYSSSPIAYKDRIITTVGGKGRGVVAMVAATGAIAWQAQDFDNGYSSPILIDLDGRPELVVFTYGEIAGLDPDTGRLEWQQAHPAEFGVNVATPIWGDDHLLFVSSAYNGGSRVLKLARTGLTVSATQVWASQRVRIHFGNAVRIGQRVFASNGDFGAAPLAAVDIGTGEMVWRDRSVARATLVGAGSRLILLDEDGNLALATPGDTGLTVHAKAQILDGRSWTAPTLSGTTLFVRNQKEIVALDLR
jgi:outer membrane protein assembly factor BamB